MTHPPDPELASTALDWGFWVILVIVGFWRRRRQNERLSTDIGKKVEAATKAEVEAIQKELKKLQISRENDATRSAIMTDRMNQLEDRVKELIEQIGGFKAALPQTADVLGKVLNTLERLKAGTLVEQPIVGSGGLTAIKKKE